MRMTSKGQVTVPEEIRRTLGLHPGCNLKFFVKQNKGCFELEDNKNPAPSRFEKVKGTATVKLSTEEIMSLMRGN